MKGVEILSRDGTARFGRLTINEKTFTLPAAYDIPEIFPALSGRYETNIPAIEDREFVARYLLRDEKQPIPVHIHVENSVKSGDTIITHFGLCGT